MWIPKNPPGGVATKILVGLGSLVLMHVAFIVGHTVLDETMPTDIAYPLDRFMEHVEYGWSYVHGTESLAEFYLHRAEERVEEYEALITKVESNAVSTEKAAHVAYRLFTDAEKVMSGVLMLLPELHTDDTEAFALVVLAESTFEDVTLRVQNSIPEEENFVHIARRAEAFLAHVEHDLELSNAVLSKFSLDDDVQQTIRTRVRDQFSPEPAPNACAVSGQECSTTADCCGGLGLTCSPFQSSSGLTRRCTQQVHRICTVECMGSAWGRAHRCEAGHIRPGMPPCDSMQTRACPVAGQTALCWQE